MRLSGMRTVSLRLAVLSLALATVSAPAIAQRAVPPGTGNTFKDTSMIKPPAGQKVAIYEFEDLECPACRQAHPMVIAAIQKYHIPFVRKDFPLPMHIWSTDAAIWARYMQDKISPTLADDYRTAVFANQTAIGSKDDLLTFTRKFLTQHGQQVPFVPDPAGEFRKEVFADKALGEKMGLSQTPTIFVCTPTSWVQVTDPTQLFQTIEQVESEEHINSAAPVKRASR